MGSCCCLCCFSKSEVEDPEPTLTTALLGNESKSVRYKSTKPPDVVTYAKYGYSLSHMEFTMVASVDKVFVDRVKVFNQFLVKYFTMRDTLKDFQRLFSLKNAEAIPVQEAVESLGRHCKGTTVTLSRTHKYCLSLSYNTDELRQRKGSLADTHLSPAITSFNALNRLIKNLMDQAPTLVDSFVLLCKDEVTVRRNVMNADLGTSREPGALKSCVENYNEMRRCHESLVQIISEIEDLWMSLVTGSQEFFK